MHGMNCIKSSKTCLTLNDKKMEFSSRLYLSVIARRPLTCDMNLSTQTRENS